MYFWPKEILKAIAGKPLLWTAKRVAAAAAMFGIVVSAPVAIDFGGAGLDLVAPNTAAAKDHDGDGDRDGDHDNIVLPTVDLAVFTTIIEKRYPANRVTVVDDPHQAVSFFTELYAMAGKKVTHRWIHEGSVKFRVSFEVKAEHWRSWSTQLLPADLAGVWTAQVVDEDGNVLESRSLIYQPAGSDQLTQQ